MSESWDFRETCRRLGVRVQGCREVSVLSNGMVTALYENGGARPRRVYWLSAPGPH